MTLPAIAVWAEAGGPGELPIMGASSKPDGLPWPPDRDDLLHFREVTRDHVLVMGRGTFDKLPARMKTPESTFERPLVVLTHTLQELERQISLEAYWHAGTFETPQDLVAWASAVHIRQKGIAVIGGPTVIEWALPVLDTLDVTTIRGRFEGDVRAPFTELALSDLFPYARTTGADGHRAVTRYDREVPKTTNEQELIP